MHRGFHASVIAAVLLTAVAVLPACAPSPPPVAEQPGEPSAGQPGEPPAAPPASCICEVGQRQSPIDLDGAMPAELPAIEFDYGETVEAEVFDTGKSVQVDFAAGDRPEIAIGGERFELVEFHFHRPAEHRAGGEAEAMELHFVHQNQVGEVAVVGVLLEDAAAEPQPLIAEIWAAVPERPGERAPIALAPEGLLPADRGYIRYAGSLTTGACAEGVRWHVLRGLLAVTPEQVEEYEHPNTARRVQPLNGRPVLVGG